MPEPTIPTARAQSPWPQPAPGGKDQAGPLRGPCHLEQAGAFRVSLAFLEMASSTPCCQIRQLMAHIYPGGHKAANAERVSVFYGRRGRPVK